MVGETFRRVLKPDAFRRGLGLKNSIYEKSKQLHCNSIFL